MEDPGLALGILLFVEGVDHAVGLFVEGVDSAVGTFFME